MLSRLHKVILTALLASGFSWFNLTNVNASDSASSVSATIEAKPAGTMGSKYPVFNNYSASLLARTSIKSYKNSVPDLSEWQGSFTNSEVKKLKREVPFVILRVQYGDSYEDHTFKHNKALMEKYKVPYGVYSFSQYTSAANAKTEAKALYKRAPKARFYINDYEDQTVRHGSTNTATKAWFTEMNKYAGKKKVLLYSNYYFMHSHAKTAVKSYDGFWLAAYQSSEPKTATHVLWQYTDNHYSKALKQHVDASISKNHSAEWFLNQSSSTLAANIKKLTYKKLDKVKYYSVKKNQTAKLSKKYKNYRLYNHVKKSHKSMVQYSWSKVKPKVGKKVYVDMKGKKSTTNWYRIRFSSNKNAKRYWVYSRALNF